MCANYLLSLLKKPSGRRMTTSDLVHELNMAKLNSH